MLAGSQDAGAWRCRVWNVHGEVYLGHFAQAAQAGRIYDIAAIRCGVMLQPLPKNRV